MFNKKQIKRKYQQIEQIKSEINELSHKLIETEKLKERVINSINDGSSYSYSGFLYLDNIFIDIKNRPNNPKSLKTYNIKNSEILREINEALEDIPVYISQLKKNKEEGNNTLNFLIDKAEEPRRKKEKHELRMSTKKNTEESKKEVILLEIEKLKIESEQAQRDHEFRIMKERTRQEELKYLREQAQLKGINNNIQNIKEFQKNS